MAQEDAHFHVFWVYASSVNAFDAEYRKLAKELRLDCSADGMSIADVRDGVKTWFEENDDWIMVVDNADSYSDFFGYENCLENDVIRSALPLQRPGTAMILYTSRHHRGGTELTDAHCLPLDKLSIPDSETLLLNKLGAPIDSSQARELIRAVEHLPMSIAHAAAYIRFTRITVSKYLDRLQGDNGLLEVLDQPFDAGRREARAPRSVVQAWLATFNLLTMQNRLAALFLFIIACLDRQSISMGVLSQATVAPHRISLDHTITLWTER